MVENINNKAVSSEGYEIFKQAQEASEKNLSKKISLLSKEIQKIKLEMDSKLEENYRVLDSKIDARYKDLESRSQNVIFGVLIVFLVAFATNDKILNNRLESNIEIDKLKSEIILLRLKNAYLK